MSTPYARTKALAKMVGCKVGDLLALAPNNDPYYSGSAADRAQAAWFHDLWSRFGYTSGVHLRRIHYQLVSHGNIEKHDGTPYENTDGCWKYLCGCGRHARLLGMVNAEDFIDRRNPDPSIFMCGDVPEREYQVTLPYGWDILPEISTDFYYSIERPRAEISGYDYTPEMQPYHVEVWVEKSTMDDLLRPLCARHSVNLVMGVGFMSITSVIGLVNRVKRIGKPTRILYVSDFDPAGVRMPVGVARQYEFWSQALGAGDADVKLMPIILTAEQAAEYDLPRTPIKKSDLRAGNFEAAHGEGAVELDALEALHPGEFSRIVEDHIRQFRDPSLEARTWDAYNRAHEAVNAAIEEAIGSELDRISEIENDISSILESYRDRVRDLNDELQRDLSPYKDDLETLRQDIEDALRVLHVDLPPLPAPKIIDDGDGWLFDSRRSYLEQMIRYKAHIGGCMPEVRS